MSARVGTTNQGRQPAVHASASEVTESPSGSSATGDYPGKDLTPLETRL